MSQAQHASDALAPRGHAVPSRNGLLILSGYGLRIAVERGQLAVSDGIGQDRRSGTLNHGRRHHMAYRHRTGRGFVVLDVVSCYCTVTRIPARRSGVAVW